MRCSCRPAVHLSVVRRFWKSLICSVITVELPTWKPAKGAARPRTPFDQRPKFGARVAQARRRQSRRRLVAVRMVRRHEVEIFLRDGVVLPARIERILAVVDADHALGWFESCRRVGPTGTALMSRMCAGFQPNSKVFLSAKTARIAAARKSSRVSLLTGPVCLYIRTNEKQSQIR